MQPESSDGFASVGTILPEGRAALLPGGSFRFESLLGSCRGGGSRVISGLRPLVATGVATPGVERVHSFQRRVFRPAPGAHGHLEVSG